MKIILATSTFELNGGGISSYAHDLVNVYKGDNEVVVITGDSYIKKIGDDFDVYNINWKNSSVDNAKKIIALFERIKPDIIVNSNAYLLSLITPYLDDEINIVNISHFVNGKLADIAGFNSEYVDSVISLSSFGKLYLDKKFNVSDKTKVKIVYNFLPQIKESDAILEKKIKNEVLTIVYPGGSSLHKSPALVSKILFSLIDTDLNFKFIWLGNTLLPISSLYTNKKTIREIIPEDKRVIFTNRLTREEAQEIIESANIFLLPSKGEGCPISLLEAMRVGTIPIVSDSKHASREIIKNGENGFIVGQNDIYSFVNLIKDIIFNSKRYESIYRNSLKTFVDEFNENKWKCNMDIVFMSKYNHTKRHPFNIFGYLVNVFRLRCLWYYNRCVEIFRSLKYHILFRIYIREYRK